MIKVSYQVIFSEERKYKHEIVKLLKYAYEQYYDEYNEDELMANVQVNYLQKFDESKALIGFDLLLSEDVAKDDEESVSKASKVVGKFNVSLKECEFISLVIKYYDHTLFHTLKDLYKKIFDIEMRLREAVSYIFLDTYREDYYNLLKDIDIRLKPSNKSDFKHNRRKAEYLSNRLENEFFYLLFSDYIKVSNPRDLKHDDLFSITSESNNFEEFKENILNRGITNSIYIAFIDEVKPIMDRLEEIRNCVAHYRSLSDEDEKNYERYFEEVDQYINDFFIEIDKPR